MLFFLNIIFVFIEIFGSWTQNNKIKIQPNSLFQETKKNKKSKQHKKTKKLRIKTKKMTKKMRQKNLKRKKTSCLILISDLDHIKFTYYNKYY